MKQILITFFLVFAARAQAGDIRSQCENAYYATGYVKLHQYTVTVTWAQISDHAHTKLEDILFDNFDIMKVQELETKSIYEVKENGSSDPMGYSVLLENLGSIPTLVACT